MTRSMKLEELLKLGKHQSDHTNFMKSIGRNGLLSWTILSHSSLPSSPSISPLSSLSPPPITSINISHNSLSLLSFQPLHSSFAV